MNTLFNTLSRVYAIPTPLTMALGDVIFAIFYLAFLTMVLWVEQKQHAPREVETGGNNKMTKTTAVVYVHKMASKKLRGRDRQLQKQVESAGLSGRQAKKLKQQKDKEYDQWLQKEELQQKQVAKAFVHHVAQSSSTTNTAAVVSGGEWMRRNVVKKSKPVKFFQPHAVVATAVEWKNDAETAVSDTANNQLAAKTQQSTVQCVIQQPTVASAVKDQQPMMTKTELVEEEPVHHIKSQDMEDVEILTNVADDKPVDAMEVDNVNDKNHDDNENIMDVDDNSPVVVDNANAVADMEDEDVGLEDDAVDAMEDDVVVELTEMAQKLTIEYEDDSVKDLRKLFGDWSLMDKDDGVEDVRVGLEHLSLDDNASDDLEGAVEDLRLGVQNIRLDDPVEDLRVGLESLTLEDDSAFDDLEGEVEDLRVGLQNLCLDDPVEELRLALEEWKLFGEEDADAMEVDGPPLGDDCWWSSKEGLLIQQQQQTKSWPGTKVSCNTKAGPLLRHGGQQTKQRQQKGRPPPLQWGTTDKTGRPPPSSWGTKDKTGPAWGNTVGVNTARPAPSLIGGQKTKQRASTWRGAGLMATRALASARRNHWWLPCESTGGFIISCRLDALEARVFTRQKPK
ncbi:expressed unknown protein [Seminavis robusta]|uniref:Uncharacterized protein n=1 Tax=Seminavis robusta TaxID=568900 RepID=A0A9N8DHP7_9STRA|nr:expressed unknown protein [Seminavis robusta]|eukprot:Sro90_g047510.1 n/a (621) ;mRNA; f:120494-123277